MSGIQRLLMAYGARVYATWNPSDKGSACTLSNGDLTATGALSNGSVRSTIGKSSGKWYWEISSTGSRYPIIGVGDLTATLGSYPGADANGFTYYGLTARKITNAVQTVYGSTWSDAAHIVGVLLDMDAGTIEFYKNGVSMGVAFTGLSGTFYAMTGGDTDGGPSDATANFGASAFTHSVPSGYNAGLYT